MVDHQLWVDPFALQRWIICMHKWAHIFMVDRACHECTPSPVCPQTWSFLSDHPSQRQLAGIMTPTHLILLPSLSLMILGVLLEIQNLLQNLMKAGCWYNCIFPSGDIPLVAIVGISGMKQRYCQQCILSEQPKSEKPWFQWVPLVYISSCFVCIEEMRGRRKSPNMFLSWGGLFELIPSIKNFIEKVILASNKVCASLVNILVDT